MPLDSIIYFAIFFHKVLVDYHVAVTIKEL